jgi:hypothetical protein
MSAELAFQQFLHETRNKGTIINQGTASHFQDKWMDKCGA